MTDVALPARAVPRRPRSPALAAFGRNLAAVAGLAAVVLFVCVAALAPSLAPYDPLETDLLLIRKAPSAARLLGTDDLGRDILSRPIYGARASPLAGSIPVSVAVGLSAMPIFARLTRGQVLAVKAEDDIEGARAIGLPHRRVVWRYVLPDALAPVQATLAVAGTIIAEASLSFLGLGLGRQPPAPSWGSTLNTAKNFLTQRRGCRSRPARRSFSPCWASTSSATGCATLSTRGRVEDAAAECFMSRRRGTSVVPRRGGQTEWR